MPRPVPIIQQRIFGETTMRNSIFGAIFLFCGCVPIPTLDDTQRSADVYRNCLDSAIVRIDDFKSSPNEVSQAANFQCLAQAKNFIATTGMANNRPAGAFIRQSSVELDGYALNRVFELRALRRNEK